VDAVKKRLKRLATTVPTAAEHALEDLARDLLRAAADAAPRDTGALADSGYTRTVAPGIVRLGFTAPHAAAVHERLDLHHATGHAKFLERAITEGKPEAIERIADAARAELASDSASESGGE
jgi:hypothetical protein